MLNSVFILDLLSLLGVGVVAWVVLARIRPEAQTGPAGKVLQYADRHLRRVAVLMAGTAVIITGIVISPLPGPGFSVLGPLGLAIMATEFVWAQRLIALVQHNTAGVRGAMSSVAAKTARWVVYPVVAGYWGIVLGIFFFHGDWLPGWLLWPVSSILFTPVFIWSLMVWRLGTRAGRPVPEQD